MPRRKYKKRQIEPDLLYQSTTIAKLINIVMRDGKKSVAETIVYRALDNIKKQGLSPVEVIEKVVENVGPTMIVKPRRIGGASYMVPRETSPKHRCFLALKWLVEAARERNNRDYHSFVDKLTAEIVDAYNSKGAAVEKKLQTEKLAEANKVFAHFAW